MSEQKLETTEAAIEDIRKQFMKMGLNEDGTIKEKSAKTATDKLSDSFKDAAKEVEDQWKQAEDPETNGVLDEGELVDESELKETIPEKDDRELVKAQADLKSKDDAIAKMQKLIDDLSEKTSKQQKQEQERLLEGIEQQRRQAVLKGDYEAVLTLDKQKQQVSGVQPALDPIYADFLKRNPWWDGTSAQEIKMRLAAEQYDGILTRRKLSPAQAISLLEEYIKADFPDYFDKDQHKSTKVAAVEGNIKAGIVKKSKRQYTVDNLDPQTQNIIKEFARIGKVKPEDYIKELIKSGMIKE